MRKGSKMTSSQMHYLKYLHSERKPLWVSVINTRNTVKQCKNITSVHKNIVIQKNANFANDSSYFKQLNQTTPAMYLTTN